MKNIKKYQIGILSVVTILGFVAMVPSLSNINAESDTQNIDYLAQANIVFDEIKSLDAEIEQIKSQETTLNSSQMDIIAQKQHKIDHLFKEISYLETLNKKLYDLDAESKQTLYDAEKIIYEQYYLNQPKETNVLYTMGPNFQSNTLDLYIDSNKLANTEKTEIEIQKEFNELLSNTNVKLVFTFSNIRDISCSSKTADCTPLISALSGNVDGDDPDDLNTISYKSTRSTDVGFVMAAHSANDDSDADIVQAHDSSRVVGNVDAIDTNNCDCAFVHADQGVGVDAEIWKNSSSNYDIVAKTDDSSQSGGTWVYKVGAATGISLGEITNNSGVTGFASVVKIHYGGGDGGSTVFTLSGDSANVYGMLIGGVNATHAVFQPHDYIEDQLSITTSTS